MIQYWYLLILVIVLMILLDSQKILLLNSILSVSKGSEENRKLLSWETCRQQVYPYYMEKQ